MGNTNASARAVDVGYPIPRDQKLPLDDKSQKHLSIPTADGQFEDAEDENVSVTSQHLTYSLPKSISGQSSNIIGPVSHNSVVSKNKKDAGSHLSSPLEALASACVAEKTQTNMILAPVEEGRKTHADQITCTDVLCGRGGQSNHHPGNIFFRRLVRAKQEEYLKANKRDKTSVALDIVKLVRGLTPPGRFLKKDPNEEGLYIEVGDKKARDKTSQALREGAPELREELRENRGGHGGVQKKEEPAKQFKTDGVRSQPVTNGIISASGIHQNTPMMNMSAAAQTSFMPFLPSLPFVAGGTSPLVASNAHLITTASGHQITPQMIQTPMGPAMVPFIANSPLHALSFPTQFGQQQVMMVAQPALMQSKNGFITGSTATTNAMGVMPILHGHQPIHDSSFLTHSNLVTGKRKAGEIEIDENNGVEHAPPKCKSQKKVR